jgi:hypothetical protein
VQRILAIALVLAAAGVAHATPAPGPARRAGAAVAAVATDLRLRPAAAPARSGGADLTVTLDTQRSRRAPSFFQEHAARVDRAFLSFLHGHTLEDLRQRDQLRLYGPPVGGVGAAANGAAIFTSAIITTAHAPRPLRVLFGRRLHFGPAIFDQGGMGAGFGGAL